MITPFKSSPNPNMYYVTGEVFEALDKIRFMISERQGLATILGDTGMGKSTLLRYLMSEYSAEGYTIGAMVHTEFPSPYAMLKYICAQFGVEGKRSQIQQHQAFEEWLVGEFDASRTPVLFIDEGQRLDNANLEVIRALLNFETHEDKLLQIVMAGTLALRDNILAKRNRAFKSRIFAPCVLNAFSLADLSAMIAFRCERVGMRVPFNDEGLARIYMLSLGIPRTALRICAHAWRTAERLGLKEVPVDFIATAASKNEVAA